VQELAAVLADAAIADRPTALLVDDQHRRPGGVGGVAIAPSEQGDEGRPEVEPLLGEEVLVAIRPALIGAALEDVLLDQSLQAGGEDVAGDTEALLQFVEAPPAVHHVAHDQQRPALADDLQGASDRADLTWIVVAQHKVILAHLVASSN
jgi:hypothetical protein